MRSQDAYRLIDWSDGVDESVATLPNDDMPLKKLIGLIGIGFSLLTAVLPVLMSVFLRFAMPVQPPEFDRFSLNPLVCFGTFCFPMAAFIFRKSVLQWRGQRELHINATQVISCMKSWPFKSRLKCRLADLDGFRIEDPKGIDVGFVTGRANLLFVRKNGRTVCLLRMAPRQVLDELLNGMLPRIERITAGTDLTGNDTIRAGEVDVEVAFPGSTAVHERTRQPIGSNVDIAEEAGEFVIHLPPVSLFSPQNRVMRLVFFGAVGCLLLMVFGLFPALMAGKVNGSPLAGWFICTVFSLLSGGIVLGIVSEVTRRGAIRICDESLVFHERTVFRSHHESWFREDIESVEVGVEETRSEDGVDITCFIEVQPGSNSATHWFETREKSELEWIATCLRGQLELES